MDDSWEPLRQRPPVSDDQWAQARHLWRRGQVLESRVVLHQPFGIFVDLGHPVLGLIEIPNLQKSNCQ